MLDAFRAQGIAPGLYFSPDDFLWLWKNKIDIQRAIPAVQPRNNPGLMKLDLAQVRELMTNYGPIDIVFFDGEPQGLRDLAWKISRIWSSPAAPSRRPSCTSPASRWKAPGKPTSPWAPHGSTSRRTSTTRPAAR